MFSQKNGLEKVHRLFSRFKGSAANIFLERMCTLNEKYKEFCYYFSTKNFTLESNHQTALPMCANLLCSDVPWALFKQLAVVLFKLFVEGYKYAGSRQSLQAIQYRYSYLQHIHCPRHISNGRHVVIIYVKCILHLIALTTAMSNESTQSRKA